jgi:hypothetical protein
MSKKIAEGFSIIDTLLEARVADLIQNFSQNIADCVLPFGPSCVKTECISINGSFVLEPFNSLLMGFLLEPLQILTKIVNVWE